MGGGTSPNEPVSSCLRDARRIYTASRGCRPMYHLLWSSGLMYNNMHLAERWPEEDFLLEMVYKCFVAAYQGWIQDFGKGVGEGVTIK